MEALLRKYDRECMKMAIMKQEEIFKQQVHELHRLYRVQTRLMRDLKNREVKSRQWLPRCSQSHLLANVDGGMLAFVPSDSPNSEITPRRRALNLALPADEYIMRAEQRTTVEVEQDIDVELTLSVGNNNNSNWTKREAAAFTCDSSSFSSSSTESAGGLRLSGGHEWGLHHQIEDACVGYQSGVKNGFEVEEGTGEEGGVKQSPRWFLECLSLKMA